MSEEQHLSDLFTTSAIISGPTVEGIKFGACVNEEYKTPSLNFNVLNNIRFDMNSNVEERMEPYSDEELDYLYRNSIIQLEEDEYYERISSAEMNKQREAYWEEMCREEEEYRRFMEEEEQREADIDYMSRFN